LGTVSISVRKAGRIIEQVDRQLCEVAGAPAIVYGERMWPVANGLIDLDMPSLESVIWSDFAAAAGDDQPVRDAIRDADAGARVLVEAGPGTGKTQIAALRLADLIRRELSPGQVLVLSFSRTAVRTLTRRLALVAGEDPQIIEELRHVSIRTFDSWAFRILRLLGEPPEVLLRRGHDENIAALTALITGPRGEDVRTLIGDRRHLIIDEFQDLPGVRGDLVLALLALLAPPERPGVGFTILGDPAQAIFGWAARAGGTAVRSPREYWQEVLERYGTGLEVRTLTHNHRADAPLAALSNEVRGVLLGELGDEEKLAIVRERLEALPQPQEELSPPWVTARGGSRAILTRTNGEAVAVLQKLVGTATEGPGAPLRLHAGSYAGLPPAWIAAMLRPARSHTVTRTQFLSIHAQVSARWDVGLQQRLGLPDAPTAWARLCKASGAAADATSLDLAELRGRMGWPDAFPDDQQSNDDGLVITTIHQSKGMEFDVVTVLESRPRAGTQDPEPDGEDDGPPDDELEELNVVYVAITRAGHELNRLPPKSIWTAPRNRRFGSGRSRLFQWWNGWMRMEMGLAGDLDPVGFVDPALLGGADGVRAVQERLLAGVGGLEGCKVMLCKTNVDGNAIYDIHLQDGNGPGLRIGRATQNLTRDLLDVLWKRGYALPGRIMNLRISTVGSLTSDSAIALEEPDRTSRLWLGVGLFGTADFKPFKRS
jgi:hypothetical protein